MAKKRRKGTKRKGHAHARRRRGHRTTVVTKTIRMSNPRRRRNPGLGGITVNAITGLAAGAATGFITTKLLGSQSMALRALGAVGVALVGTFFLRKRPELAAAWGGTSIGTMGFGFGVNAGGGLYATNKPDAVAALAKMPDVKQTTPPPAATGTAGMGVLLPMNRPGMGVLYNSNAARSLTGMGAATSVRRPINPRALLG